MNNTVQDFINEKARERCWNDVEIFIQTLRNAPFIRLVEYQVKLSIPNFAEGEQLHNMLNGANSGLGAFIMEKALPAYVTEESKKFYDSIQKAIKPPKP